MALHEIQFSCKCDKIEFHMSKEWSHTGVVGSGDMEVLLTKKPQEGKTTVKIVTPVQGFDHIWVMVLEKFVGENGVGDMDIQINDNNATPFIAAMRLKQAIMEAGEEANA